MVRHGARFSTLTEPVAVDMAKVRQRKRDMVEGLIAMHLASTAKAESLMGTRGRKNPISKARPRSRRFFPYRLQRSPQELRAFLQPAPLVGYEVRLQDRHHAVAADDSW